MIYFVYDQTEKDYHDLTSSTCDCVPELRMLETGDMLLIHQSLVEPETVYEEKMIENAISIIMSEKL